MRLLQQTSVSGQVRNLQLLITRVQGLWATSYASRAGSMCHVHLQQDILPHKGQQHPQYLLFSIIACQNLRLLSTLGVETGKRR
jgi:hypothetical protein